MVVGSFNQKKKKKNLFLVIAIYQAQNPTFALPLYEKNEYKPPNIENLDDIHFASL